jgi:carboxypeptidase Taq
MWENMIGRSRSFWRHFYPELQRQFPEQLSGVDESRFYRGINKVEPSHIRIEADEVTYSLHIILRFNLERRLIEGDLEVDDLPEAWREESRALLGIVPETEAQGVLQDVHWSHGALGYFPTYALGNLYAAQFLDTMQQALPDMWERVAAGDLSSVLGWLRERIHQPGSSRTAEELCEEVSGGALTPGYFTDYLRRKFRPIYGLS